MKKLLALSLLTLPLFAAPLQPVQIWVAWQDTNNIPVLPIYVPGTNDAYILLGTTTVNTPITNWQTVATWTSWALGTNNGQIWYSNSIAVTPGTWFFSIISTNFWGVSDPSNVAQTGPVSTSPVNLKLSR